MKRKRKRDWNWVKGELDWAWNGGRRLWIIAGMVTGAVPGGALGTYGFFNLKAGAVDIAISGGEPVLHLRHHPLRSGHRGQLVDGPGTNQRHLRGQTETRGRGTE